MIKINNKQEFFELLKYSNELRKNNKSLFKENPEKSRKLSRFLIIIEENLHLRQKDQYIELIEIFLTNKIDAEDFSFYFIAKYDNITQILREMKQDFEKKFDELSNLLRENKNKKYQIGMSLMLMYDNCDQFNPDSNSLKTINGFKHPEFEFLTKELEILS